MNPQNTTKNKLIFWISTGIIALFHIPALFFVNSQLAIDGTNHVWPFPEWFRLEVSYAQVLGALILICVFLPNRIIERAYVGLWILYISAFIAHLNADGIVPMSFLPLAFIVILAISYIYFHKIRSQDIK